MAGSMLTIGEFSKLCCVSRHTLRYYDEIGVLKPSAVNDENGYRYYQRDQVRTMLLIHRLKQYRFSLPEILAALASNDQRSYADVIKQKSKLLLSEIQAEQAILRRMAEDIQKIEEGIDMMKNELEVILAQTQPVNICGFRKKMGLKDFDAAFGELMGYVQRKNLGICGAVMAIYHDSEFDPDCSDIEVAVPVEKQDEKTRVLAGGRCAMGVHLGRYDNLQETYAAIEGWLCEKGYVIAGAPYEKYVKNDFSGSPDNFVTEVYFPIK